MLFKSADDFKRRALDFRIGLVTGASLPNGYDEMPVVRFSIEQLPNAKIALARTFVSWLGEFQDCEFWISEFGIWPSSEDRNLYVRLRSTYGDSRNLNEAPTHVFGKDEKPDLETHLSIAIQFGWGGHLLPNPSLTYLFLSHDGWLHAASKDLHAKIKEDLDALEIDYKIGCDR